MLANIMFSSKKYVHPVSHLLIEYLGPLNKRKQIRKNTYLFREGLEANEVYVIQSGLIQVSKLTADGKEIVLQISNPYDMVGELSLFSTESNYTLSGKVLTSGEVLVIPRDELEKALLTNSELAIEYMKWCSIQLRKYQTKLRDLLFNGKKGALYSTLIRLSNSFGIKQVDGILINIALTNQELANFCGATRESVNRLLTELRKLNIISIEQSGKLLIRNMEYLKKTICCENCPIEICNIN